MFNQFRRLVGHKFGIGIEYWWNLDLQFFDVESWWIEGAGVIMLADRRKKFVPLSQMMSTLVPAATPYRLRQARDDDHYHIESEEVFH